MPSVLAVLRLMTSSNLVGCCTGKSAGLAPLRIFPAYSVHHTRDDGARAVGAMMMMTSASASGGDGGVAGSLSEVQRATGSSTAIAEFCTGAVLDGAPTNAWDVAFLVIDPARSAVADFSPPYMQSNYTYLVPSASSISKVADADRPGIRIGVPRGDAVDLVPGI